MSYHEQLDAYEICNFIQQKGYEKILQNMYEILYFSEKSDTPLCFDVPLLRNKIKEALEILREKNL